MFTALELLQPLAALPAQAGKSHFHYQIRCRIYDEFGQLLRAYPGAECVFFPDGRVLIGDWRSIRFYNAEMSLIWSKPYPSHHQLNLSADGKTILTLSSANHELKGKLLRFDVLRLVSIDGKDIAYYDLFEHLSEINQFRPNYSKGSEGELWPELAQDLGVEHEFSHINSFYELPDNQAAKKNHAFEPGGYLVNGNLISMTFVLDHRLKKILWAGPHRSSSDGHSTGRHDVQMQPNGWLIAYENGFQEHPKLASAIVEINPVTSEYRVLYQGTESKPFSSEVCGGVQRTENGGILTSEITPQVRAFEIDSRGKETWSMNFQLFDKHGKQDNIQQIRRINLSAFLKANPGI